MKRFNNILFGLIIICICISCGITENPEVVRQIRNTVSECIRTYSDKYNDSTWISDNFYSIFFADLNSYNEIEKQIKEKKLEFTTFEGLKIYKEVSRKDLRYLKNDDSYLVRNDFVVIAIYKNETIELLKEPKIAMQYYRLKKDSKDNNKYKIIEVYLSMDQNDLIYKETFIENYKDFTQNEEIKNQVERVK